MGGGSVFNRPLSEHPGTALESWHLCCRGHRHLQQAVVLALAGHAVAVLGGTLDELHAYFVLLELHQKPVTQKHQAHH